MYFLFYDSEKLQFLFYISIFLSVLNVCCANLDLFLYFIFTFEKHLKNGKYTSFIKKKFIHIYILTHFIYINIYIHTYATIYKNNDIYIYIINIHIHIYIYEIYEINNIYIYILFTGALENHVLVKCYFDPVISYTDI